MWESKEAFKQRVREWADKIGVEVHTISLRAMKNKWASYTKRTDLLIFNVELLDMDEELGDYVIVHELLHFIVPNHGKLWKSLMLAHLGDYQTIEEQIRGKGIDVEKMMGEKEPIKSKRT
jgi:predicted metal-dependent hydrolase